MIMFLLNIETLDENSIIIYAVNENPTKSSNKSDKAATPCTIQVKNIFPSWLVHDTSENSRERLDQYLKSKKIEAKIKKIQKKNIFIPNFPNNIDFYCVEGLDSHIMKMKSYKCDLIINEFKTSKEKFIIERNIKGPCYIKLNNYHQTSQDTYIIDHPNDVVFVKNDKIPNVKLAILSIKYIGQDIQNFSLKIRTFNHDQENCIQGSLKLRTEVENNLLKNEGIFLYSSPLNVIEHLKGIFKTHSPSFLLFHHIPTYILEKISNKGVILCDLYKMVQKCITGRDFTLNELANNLKLNFKMQAPAKKITETVYNLHHENILVEKIFDTLELIELSKQITEISGNLLSETVDDQTTKRITYLILHAAYERNIVIYSKEDRKDFKGVGYIGGMVLKPDIGFYETLIGLLDFNSLYPSIIREYNICYSTMKAYESEFNQLKTDAERDDLFKRIQTDSNDNESGFLPSIITNLIERRLQVKTLITKTSEMSQKRTLDTRQKALKLTANSIYGCLGSKYSQFGNLLIASYITFKGRSILKDTNNIAINHPGVQVVYGDTDSIMINTHLEGDFLNYNQAVKTCEELIQKVNKKYKFIKLDIDKIFKRLALFTKKKYGGLVLNKNGDKHIDSKGLDFSRRDQPDVARIITSKVFNLMMLDNEQEKIKEGNENKSIVGQTSNLNANNQALVQRMLSSMIELKENIGTFSIDHFVINAQLAKDPKDYNTAHLVPHVALALRLSKKNINLRKNDIVSYVIGLGKKNEPISNRLFTPHEVCNIDHEYYIKNYIVPCLYRLTSIYKGLGSEEISRIFGTKKVMYEVAASKSDISILTPCCKKTQKPNLICLGCNQKISVSFYIYKTYQLLTDRIAKLYDITYGCNACSITTWNHIDICPSCGSEMKLKVENDSFNEYMDSLYESFSSIEECKTIIEGVLANCDYKRVDFYKYFKPHCDNYIKNENY